MKTKILSLFCAALSLCACSNETLENRELTIDLPAKPYTYATGSYIPTLGRVLFYDRQLSLNNSVSCGTCHQQRLAFSDNKRFSVGFEDKLTSRNSMPIQNITIQSRLDSSMTDPNGRFVLNFLFWDGREHDLMKMVREPIKNHIEMGFSDLGRLEKKLSTLPYYEKLFADAFGDKAVTEERIAIAISSFIQSISSQRTKFDKSLIGESKLSQIEQRGRDLFTSVYDCNSCHQIEDPHGYIISGGTFANIGLDKNYEDNGLGEISRQAADNGKFKIPSLRNVAVTGPYMHDGRFTTLDEVMNRYSDAIADHNNLDHRLRTATGEPRVMNISKSEKDAIIAFMHTLTDHEMLTDPKFSDPFKAQ